jgi:hypothetical protein
MTAKKDVRTLDEIARSFAHDRDFQKNRASGRRYVVRAYSRLRRDANGSPPTFSAAGQVAHVASPTVKP